MLLDQATLAGIRRGTITLAFRRWRRPTVRSGGTLLTSIGQLAIESVDRVDLDEISDSDARAAGFDDADRLRSWVSRRSTGDDYRVRLALLGPDPRIALREAVPDAAEMEELLSRLARLDARSPSGPWTGRVLSLVERQPETRASELANQVGLERDDFKTRVRRLKRLGLTESLPVGYRLSRRGEAVRRRLEGEG